jgi:ATP-binding cassette, subfamily B, multidrug efflux pump
MGRSSPFHPALLQSTYEVAVMSNNHYLNEDASLTGEHKKASMMLMLRYAKPHWFLFVVGIALIASASAFALGSAYLMGLVVDKGLIPGDGATTARIVAMIIGVEILGSLATFFGRRGLSAAASKAIFGLRKSMVEHCRQLSLTFYDRQPQGRLIVRMTHDVEELEMFFSNSAGRLGLWFLLIINCCFAMLLTDMRLGLMLMLAMVPVIVITWKSRINSRELNRHISAGSSAVNSRLAEYIDGHSVIRSFGLEEWSLKRFNDRVLTYLTSCKAMNRFNCRIRPTIDTLCHLPLLCLLYWGGSRVLAGTLSVGLLVTFVRYCERFSRSILDVSREIHVLQVVFTNLERVSHFMAAETEEEALGIDGFEDAHLVDGRIEFQGVSLSYNGEDSVLSDLEFTVEPGSQIGLLGRTGSGKTSTVSILTRLYEHQGGIILLDGKPLRSYKRSSLRSAIGFVSQDSVLFRGSVFENLNVDGRYSIIEVQQAAKQTGLAGVLENAGLTLESHLLDKGANLSAGERQLIAITRILLKRPKILVLDEATASVDPVLEKAIHKAVEEVMKGRTCLIIAHRLDTLKRCDRLLVFRDGKIVEEGSHEVLLQQKGYYYDLHMTSTSSEPAVIH